MYVGVVDTDVEAFSEKAFDYIYDRAVAEIIGPRSALGSVPTLTLSVNARSFSSGILT